MGIGNACGFVEPLEATALHMIGQQLEGMCRTLREGDFHVIPEVVAVENHYYREKCDDIRDFLAVHYKFNRRLVTPFWRHCQEQTNLGGAQGLVDFYEAAGPSYMCRHYIPRSSIFGYNGYMVMLIGQRVSTRFNYAPSQKDREIWKQHQKSVRKVISHAMPMREALHVFLSAAK